MNITRWHGDVKPDNILRVHGKYKLADFGFAEFEEDKGNPKDLYTNLIGGTRTYGTKHVQHLLECIGADLTNLASCRSP